jgi:hypothetical protein
MLKTVLITVSIAMSIGANIPLYRRLSKRQHTRDFSRTSSLLIWLYQITNLALATAEHAPFLIWWYVIQIAFAGITLCLVCKYWDRLPPPIPQEIVEQRLKKANGGNVG